MFDQDRVYEAPVPIKRATAHPQSFLITTPNAVELTTHWFGTSLVCSGKDCPACNEAWQWRTVFYVGAIAAGGNRVILELPHHLSGQIDRAKVDFKMVGHAWKVQTIGKSGNKVQLEIAEEAYDGVVHPVERNALLDQIARIYHLPRRRDFDNDQEWGKAMKEKAAQKLTMGLSSSAAQESNL